VQVKEARNAGVDAVRFLALVGVAFIHAGELIPEGANKQLATLVDLFCRFGVPFFFVASGYFLTRASPSFYEARYERRFPGARSSC
jgi:peptidoglycan/LPS O-acetylase OafA/YrhL